MTLFLENNPIFAQEVAVAERPPIPLVIQANHQESISQLSIRIIIPFELGYSGVLMDYCFNCLRKGHQGLCSLGDWAAGCAGLLFHSGNSLSNSAWTNGSIKARWLMSSFSQSMRIIALQSIDSLKLIGCFIDSIVVRNALRVKVQN